jgi:hypothetical protein
MVLHVFQWGRLLAFSFPSMRDRFSGANQERLPKSATKGIFSGARLLK